MSLKNLVNKARTVRNAHNIGQARGAKLSNNFNALTYDLNHRMPSKDEIKSILTGLLDDLNAHDGELTTEYKNRLILASFRLAFSQDARAVGCFHPSEISREENPCKRKMYFQYGRVKKDATYVNFTADNRMMRLVDLGSLVHLYIQENLDRLSVLSGFELDVISKKYGITGKMDGAIHFSGLDDLNEFYNEDMALEIKTINDYGFRALREAKKDHRRQASIYGGILGYKNICFIYYNKNNSELKVYVHPVDIDYVNYFKGLADDVITRFKQNKLKNRSSDVSKHSNIFTKICKNRTNKRAMDCEYADFCFNHKTK
tara:strand:+ start:67563 stop:68510 length:948 start_codon:yes stop_codon:yes gene_type:complete